MPSPRVFISYSHDSEAHKAWVEKLARRLQEAAIEVVLDRWNVRLGADLPLFMERELQDADRVLLVCTEKYTQKAEAGTGGVGYERMIVTAELVKSIDTIRFVPVLKQEATPRRIPKFLGSRAYLDLSDDQTFDANVGRLVDDLLLGDGPAQPAPAATTIRAGDEVSSVFERAAKLARDQDRAGWRKLSRELRASFILKLREIRERHEKDAQSKPEAAADDVVRILEPVLAQLLSGFQAGYADVQEQQAFIDAVLHISGWNRGGYMHLINLPKVAIFVFQAICGAGALVEGRLDAALELAETSIIEPAGMPTMPLWRRHDLLGWIESLGGSCKKSWDFLDGLYEKLPSLQRAFADEAEFHAALSAHYLAMNVDELAVWISENKDWRSLIAQPLDLDVPITFIKYGSTIITKAILLIERTPSGKAIIWSRHGVPTASMVEAWPAWVGHCISWVRNVFSNWMYWFDDIAFKNLIR